MKTIKVFIGHAVGNDFTEVGFYKGNERFKWYTSASNASINRLERVLYDLKPQPMLTSKQVWIVYRINHE